MPSALLRQLVVDEDRVIAVRLVLLVGVECRSNLLAMPVGEFADSNDDP
jgi:hypothetical protein